MLFWIPVLSGFLYIKQINCDPDHLTSLDNKSPCAVLRWPWYQRQSDPNYVTHKLLLNNNPMPCYSLGVRKYPF